MVVVVPAISIMMGLFGPVGTQVAAMHSINLLTMLEPILGVLALVTAVAVIQMETVLGVAVVLILSILIWLFTGNALGSVRAVMLKVIHILVANLVEVGIIFGAAGADVILIVPLMRLLQLELGLGPTLLVNTKFHQPINAKFVISGVTFVMVPRMKTAIPVSTTIILLTIPQVHAQRDSAQLDIPHNTHATMTSVILQ